MLSIFLGLLSWSKGLSLILKYLILVLNKFLSIDSLPKVLLMGTKILSIEFRHVKIIDSYSFIPMGLDKFAKSFNIKEHKKGFFPHLI